MKVLHLSTPLLSACSWSPVSMGQWQMKAQIDSVREDITVFSFESVWCSTLWWFEHYFMSIIKKTSNKMLNSKSDRRAKMWFVCSDCIYIPVCACVCAFEVYFLMHYTRRFSKLEWKMFTEQAFGMDSPWSCLKNIIITFLFIINKLKSILADNVYSLE